MTARCPGIDRTMPRHRVVRCGLIVRSIGLNYAVDSGPSKGRFRSIVQAAKKTAPESDPEQSFPSYLFRDFISSYIPVYLPS